MPTGLVDRKYGRLTVENDPATPFHEDEPAFVFRGQDQLTVAALNAYVAHCEANGASEEHIAEVRQTIDEMVEWQDAHPDLLKIPS